MNRGEKVMEERDMRVIMNGSEVDARLYGYIPKERVKEKRKKARSRSSSNNLIPSRCLQTLHNPHLHGTHLLHTSPYHDTMPITSI
ncbi:hypothetical protein Pcinc_007322 [Petrolisthes cinctipes]|uniref:Uncharacterized protein n=1 Tax=Petrolisthes cinctipes TaxID=88211 RepID=A0AAE1GAZ8_PETCI|nr:hypothetical protein Pcinc_007322 [Petrolisthes cinctipes]